MREREREMGRERERVPDASDEDALRFLWCDFVSDSESANIIVHLQTNALSFE